MYTNYLCEYVEYCVNLIDIDNVSLASSILFFINKNRKFIIKVSKNRIWCHKKNIILLN